MTENEKRLRRELDAMEAAYPGRAHKAKVFLDAMCEAHTAALSAAWAKALEEVSAFLHSDKAKDFLGGYAPVDKDLNRMVRWLDRRIHTLITTPAPASIPAERAREVLIRERNAALVAHQDLSVESVIDDIARALGVPLDAAQEGNPETMTPTLLDAPMPSQCGGCVHRIHAPGMCLAENGSCDCRWTP